MAVSNMRNRTSDSNNLQRAPFGRLCRLCRTFTAVGRKLPTIQSGGGFGRLNRFCRTIDDGGGLPRLLYVCSSAVSPLL